MPRIQIINVFNILGLLFSLIFSTSPGQQREIIITEILKDPLGFENLIPGGASHEFVEFLNISADTIYLGDLFLSDGITSDSIIPWLSPLSGHHNCCYNRDYLKPGQIALIHDQDYSQSPPVNYFSIKDSTLILTVDASSLTNGITKNEGLFIYRGTRTKIIDLLDAMIDPDSFMGLGYKAVHNYSGIALEGFSFIPLSNFFEPRTYGINPDTITTGQYNHINNNWLSEYRFSSPGTNVSTLSCSLAVLMIGKESPQNGTWSLWNMNSQAAILNGTLPPSPYPYRFSLQIPKDSVIYELRLTDYGQTAKKRIDISQVWIPGSPLKINEIFPRATALLPEWIEITNNVSMPINIKNWRLGTSAGNDTITNSDLIINPGGYLILTKDITQFSVLYNIGIQAIEPQLWHSLDNYQDTLYLFNSLDSLACEKVYYDHDWFTNWDNQSVERIHLQGDGMTRSSWALASKLSPGLPNPGIGWQMVDQPSLHIGPIPFTPNNDGINDSLAISLTLPAGQTATLEIWGFNGRKLYEFSGPVSRRMTWNGRLSNGTPAPVGPFFVIETIVNNNQKSTIRKKGILWR